VGIIQNLSPSEKREVYKGVLMNKAIAEEGLRGDYGLGLGKKLLAMREKGIISDSVLTDVRIMAAAAGDARMGGANMPVMSTCGSGNQGITALIPPLVVSERFELNKDRLIESAMLSHLVTKLVSDNSGYLSAMCGCSIKAGIGATAAVTYLMGGDIERINNAINITTANITGTICDGAKEGCSLKLSTAAGTATESAFMALEGMVVPSDNGIVFEKAEDTIKGIGKISKAMVATDGAIVGIMQEK
jgi:L-cysteine desulfidase